MSVFPEGRAGAPQHARDHIDSNFATDIDLEEATRIARLSKFHFLRLFAATYGVTPRAYLTNGRGRPRRTCCERPTSR